MTKGSVGETGFRMLLLEATPGSLAAASIGWDTAELVTRSLADVQGVADQISRERVQVLFCDLNGDDCSALDVLSQIRRVHPNLPQVAVLPEENFSLAQAAFRNGVDDVLVHPLKETELLAVRDYLRGREKQEIEQFRTQQEAQRSLDDLILLKAIGETTRSAEDLQKLLDRVVDLIQAALDVDIVSLMLAEDDNVLRIRSACGLPDDMRHRVSIAPGEGVAGHVLEHGKPVLIDDLSTDGRFPPRDGVVRYRTGSLLSVPISYQQHTMGVLNVNNKRNGEAFTGAEQELLLTIAQQTALAIENMKLVGRLHEKTMEMEAAHTSLMKLHHDRTRFVCNLSHELKTPLTSVLGFSDLLLNYFDQIDEGKLLEYIASIYSEGKHLEHLLTGMLRLFSIDSGSENWNWQSVSMDAPLWRVLKNHDARIREMNLEVQVDFPEDLLPVWADQDKLELLLESLVDNAVKFNRQDGRISVVARNLSLHAQSALYLQISNQGKTVPRESSEDIFQEYSQLGDLDAGKPSGIGVGLATCRAILRQMQGEIFLEPSDEEGTSIGLLLPTRMELNNG